MRISTKYSFAAFCLLQNWWCGNAVLVRLDRFPLSHFPFHATGSDVGKGKRWKFKWRQLQITWLVSRSHRSAARTRARLNRPIGCSFFFVFWSRVGNEKKMRLLRPHRIRIWIVRDCEWIGFNWENPAGVVHDAAIVHDPSVCPRPGGEQRKLDTKKRPLRWKKNERKPWKRQPTLSGSTSIKDLLLLLLLLLFSAYFSLHSESLLQVLITLPLTKEMINNSMKWSRVLTLHSRVETEN